MLRKVQRIVRGFLRWLFGRPAESLPPEFGNPVPPDLRTFEEEMGEVQRNPTGTAPKEPAHPRRHPNPPH